MPATTRPEPHLPDGIDAENLQPDAPFRRHSSLFSLVLLGAVVAWGLSGLAGDRHADHSVDNASGRFELWAPVIARCGNVIESRVHVVAKRRIAKLVIGVDAPLWHQITTNSMVPAAASEASVQGQHRFSFDAIEAGQRFDLQIAQQINPSLFGVNHGRVIFLDGDQPLAEMALEIKVLP